jgi:hypothetical protein
MHAAYTAADMILFKTGLRYLLRRPLLSLLCVLGVALGVAVVIAIDLANESASRAFNLSTETVAGRTTHQIVGVNGLLDQEVYRKVKIDMGARLCPRGARVCDRRRAGRTTAAAAGSRRVR